MKEYEKLAEAFAGNMDVWADDWKKAYITGFLKARELAAEACIANTWVDHKVHKIIQNLGEKEV